MDKFDYITSFGYDCSSLLMMNYICPEKRLKYFFDNIVLYSNDYLKVFDTDFLISLLDGTSTIDIQIKDDKLKLQQLFNDIDSYDGSKKLKLKFSITIKNKDGKSIFIDVIHIDNQKLYNMLENPASVEELINNAKINCFPIIRENVITRLRNAIQFNTQHTNSRILFVRTIKRQLDGEQKDGLIELKKLLDKNFPNSKLILISKEHQLYESIIPFDMITFNFNSWIFSFDDSILLNSLLEEKGIKL